MRRREFIAGLGSAAAWPVLARAQQGERVRRIGFLWSLLSPDGSQAIATVFAQGLEERGWSVGKNLRVDHRWALGDPDRLRRSAEELATLAPDALVAGGGSAATALQQTTRTLPIVFGNVPDPVGAGFVESLARPGGNMTGFMSIEYSQSAKWLELLKQIAPQVKRVAILRAVVGGAGPAQFAAPRGIAFANIDASAAGNRVGPNHRVHCILRIFVLSLVVGQARPHTEFGCLTVVHRIVAVDRAQPLDPTLHLGWQVFIGRPGTCEQRVAK
jgi:hypothetical protein